MRLAVNPETPIYSDFEVGVGDAISDKGSHMLTYSHAEYTVH